MKRGDVVKVYGQSYNPDCFNRSCSRCGPDNECMKRMIKGKGVIVKKQPGRRRARQSAFTEYLVLVGGEVRLFMCSSVHDLV
jgi:hypothetical protein